MCRCQLAAHIAIVPPQLPSYLQPHSSLAIYNQLNIYAAPFISRRPGRRSSDGGAQEEEGEGRDVHLSVSTPALCSLCSALVTRHN